MLPVEFLLHAHGRAVEFKTMTVQDRGAKAQVPFIVVANRGSEHVATFFPLNRDPMLWTMRLAGGAFGCDLFACTVDAYGVVQGVDPPGPLTYGTGHPTGAELRLDDKQRASFGTDKNLDHHGGHLQRREEKACSSS